MKLIIFLIASLFIFTGFMGLLNMNENSNITIKHNPYPVNVNNSVSYIREFPINLNNVPSGNGYYQQLINIGNSSFPFSNYAINSQSSNIQFISQNNSYLYAWIQNINTTTITVWVKNFNSSNTINMQVLPSFENLFSVTGYLGEAPQLSSTYAEYDNGKYVFKYYDNFLNGSGLSIYSGTSAVFNDGLELNGSLRTNATFPYGVMGLYGNYTNKVPSGANPYSYTDFQNTTNLQDVIFGWFGGNGYSFLDSNITNSHNNIGISTSYQGKFTLYSLYMNSSDPSNFYLTYGNYKYSLSNQPQFYSASNYITISSPSYGNSYFYYLFVRTPLSAMPTYTIGTGYYFLNITSIYTNTNTSISNNYFWNGHITDIECYVLPELNNQPIIPLNYSGYITNSGLIYLNSSQFVNYHYNITFKYYSTVSPINYTFNEFYMPIFELGMIFLIGSVVYIEIRGYYKSMKER